MSLVFEHLAMLGIFAVLGLAAIMVGASLPAQRPPWTDLSPE